MPQNKLLMLFVRKPELGKVKTRLAQDVGDAKALEIYIKLLHHTHTITQALPADKQVYYAGEIEQHDFWQKPVYQKRKQPEGDLGFKMEQAFATAFKDGYNAVIIIGSDCHELTQHIIEQAYDALQNHDVVIGPAKDGGYYLLGMKVLHSELFRNKQWSTSSVLTDTLSDLKYSELTYTLLPVLSDVDHVTDVDAAWLS
jgi:uncharacterized protein